MDPKDSKTRSNEGDIRLAGLILEVVPGTMRKLRREVQGARSDLTIPQLRVLAHLFQGNDTALQLAELQAVSLPAISKMVEGLVKRGFIARSFKEGNRKQVFLRLTESGNSRYLQTRRVAQDRLSLQISKLNKDEKAEIERGLQVLRKFAKFENPQEE